MQPPDEHARFGRGNFDRYFIRFELNERLSGDDSVSIRLQPARDGSLDD